MPSVPHVPVGNWCARVTGKLKNGHAAVDTHPRLMHHHARGQAVVEFCMVALLFFTLMFSIIDLGMLLNDWISVTTGASVGARQAAIGACVGWFDGSRSGCPNGEHTIVEVVRESAPVLGVTVPTWVALIDWNNGCDATGCTAYCRPWPATSGWQPAQEPSDANPPPPTRRWATCTAAGASGYDDPTDADGTPGQQINDTLTVVVRAQVELPIAVPGLAGDIQAQSSSTVRFEGNYVQ